MQSLTIVTGNTLKHQELSSKLAPFFQCTQQRVDGYEIQGTPEAIILHKLRHAYETLQTPVLVDDTSLHLWVLNWFPGPYIRDFFSAFTPYEMGVRFAGSRVQVVCRLAVMREREDYLIVDGKIQGTVVLPTTTDHQGREFDLFLQVDGTDKPMIDYSLEEKNTFSHRGKALDALLKELAQKQLEV